jgi:hypothetical protein
VTTLPQLKQNDADRNNRPAKGACSAAQLMLFAKQGKNAPNSDAGTYQIC